MFADVEKSRLPPPKVPLKSRTLPAVAPGAEGGDWFIGQLIIAIENTKGQMPRNHRAGRRVQLRKLICYYREAPVISDELLGIVPQTIIKKETNPPVFGHTLVVGEWAAPKPDQAQEISGTSSYGTAVVFLYCWNVLYHPESIWRRRVLEIKL